MSAPYTTGQSPKFFSLLGILVLNELHMVSKIGATILTTHMEDGLAATKYAVDRALDVAAIIVMPAFVIKQCVVSA